MLVSRHGLIDKYNQVNHSLQYNNNNLICITPECQRLQRRWKIDNENALKIDTSAQSFSEPLTENSTSTL